MVKIRTHGHLLCITQKNPYFFLIIHPALNVFQTDFYQNIERSFFLASYDENIIFVLHPALPTRQALNQQVPRCPYLKYIWLALEDLLHSLGLLEVP